MQLRSSTSAAFTCAADSVSSIKQINHAETNIKINYALTTVNMQTLDYNPMKTDIALLNIIRMIKNRMPTRFDLHEMSRHEKMDWIRNLSELYYTFNYYSEELLQNQHVHYVHITMLTILSQIHIFRELVKNAITHNKNKCVHILYEELDNSLRLYESLYE